MHIFQPKPPPPPDPVIYAVDGLLCHETWAAVEIVIAGRLPTSPLLFENAPATPNAWEDWIETEFGTRFAPWMLGAREAAQQGVLELAEQDRMLAAHLPAARVPASTAFGFALLETTLGAKHMHEVSKFHRLVTSGKTPGHSMAVLALRSVLFGVATVNSFVACLFCEWVGAQLSKSGPLPDRDRLRSGFAAGTPSLPKLISRWLQASNNIAFQAAKEGRAH